VGMASGYALMGGLGRADGVMVQAPAILGAAGTIESPVVLPEAALLVPITLVPFIAFCVMVGLQWSLKTRGTISAVVFTVLVIGVIAGPVGLCGWQGAMSIELIGPAIAATNPLTTLLAAIEPADAMRRTVDNQGLLVARIALAVGSLVGAALSIFVVLGVRTAMVKSFDYVTRRLAGRG
jgi:hypothetical protein